MNGTILPPIIEQSWKRCEHLYHMDQSCTFDEIVSKGKQKLTKNDYRIGPETRNLINAANELLPLLTTLMSGTCLALFDKNGVFLRHWGKNVVKINPFIWTEDIVGTSGISLVITEGKPIKLTKDEYYLDVFKVFETLSLPISDSSHNILGCISLLTLGELPPQSMELMTIVSRCIAALLEKPVRCDFKDITRLLDRFNNKYCAIIDNEGNIISANEDILIKLGYRDVRELEAAKLADLLDLGGIGSLPQAHQEETVAHLNDMFSRIKNKRKTRLPATLVQWDRLSVLNEPYTILSFTLNKSLQHSNIGIASLIPDTEVIGQSREWKATINSVIKAAKTPYTVLLEGESGSGKELLAQMIHKSSNRSGAFVAVNCAALPDNIALSEFFGYEAGAFTGALKGGQVGKFERADGGTLFLDEIGDMPFEAQSYLLRFLEDKTITKIGGFNTKQVDVRVIVATNKLLEQEVEAGRFRKDLFYRLKTIEIKVPALRQRTTDIQLIANHFLNKICLDLNHEPMRFSDESIQALASHDWPGNIRELISAIERAVVFCEGNIVRPNDLGICPTDQAALREPSSPMKESEREAIIQALKLFGGNITATAKYLDIGRNTLYRKTKLYGVKPGSLK